MTALSVIDQPALAATVPREVLTCRLGDEEYGVDILAVQEIRRFEPATRIANAPALLLGVMNLRGVIVPIIDLRHRLTLPANIGPHTVTVVVNVGNRTVGLVVDAVADVVGLSAEQIKPPPRVSNGVGAEHLVGLASLDSADGHRLLLLVDLDALLRDI